ncbi:hypothetical protein ACOSP7_013057 [Xanthoceras sorbifolium]
MGWTTFDTVKKLGMKEVAIEPFDVRVANGEQLKCEVSDSEVAEEDETSSDEGELRT